MLGFCAFLLLALSRSSVTEPDTPERVLKSYLEAIYSRDYPAAYELVSQEDRRLQTQADYARAHGTFSGAALEVARALASYIRYERLRVRIEGDLARIVLKPILPDANDPAIQALTFGFDERQLAALSVSDRKAIVQKLDTMARAGRLPMIVGEDEKWSLSRARGAWRVSLHWADAIVVRFTAVVEPGLPWAFEPLQPLVRAMRGETLRALYRVKNLSARTITAKARHVMDPREETGYVQVGTCFCFIEQTLEPGESRELPVVFRVNDDLPRSLKEVKIRYEFYPLDRFPGGSERSPGSRN